MNDSTLDLNASTRQFEILLKKSRVVKELIANREICQRKDAKAEIRRFIVFFNKFYDKGCQEYIGKDDYTILNKSLVTLSLCKGALKNVEFALKNKVSLDVTNQLALFFAILFAAIKGFTSCQMKGLKHGEKLSREIRAYLDNLFPV